MLSAFHKLETEDYIETIKLIKDELIMNSGLSDIKAYGFSIYTGASREFSAHLLCASSASTSSLDHPAPLTILYSHTLFGHNSVGKFPAL